MVWLDRSSRHHWPPTQQLTWTDARHAPVLAVSEWSSSLEASTIKEEALSCTKMIYRSKNKNEDTKPTTTTNETMLNLQDGDRTFQTSHISETTLHNHARLFPDRSQTLPRPFPDRAQIVPGSHPRSTDRVPTECRQNSPKKSADRNKYSPRFWAKTEYRPSTALVPTEYRQSTDRHS